MNSLLLILDEKAATLLLSNRTEVSPWGSKDSCVSLHEEQVSYSRGPGSVHRKGSSARQNLFGKETRQKESHLLATVH